MNTTLDSSEAVTSPAPPLRRSLWSRVPESLRPTIPLVIAIVVLGAVATSRSGDFLTSNNLQNLLEQVAVLGVLSVGATFLMAAGLLDLSVGSGATLVTIICAKLLVHGDSETVAVIASLALGLAIGLITGGIVATTRVAPFILTLGGLSVLSAIALIVSNQQPISVGLHLAQLDLNKFLGIPLPFWVFLGALVIGAVILRYTRLGRSAYSIGSNEEAAYLSGIPVGTVKIGLYALNGVAVGLAGLLLVARLGSGDPNAGTGLELQAIAAVVLGGASLAGGRGTMLGTFLGVMLLGVISNSLTIAGVQSFYQTLVQGGVLIVAVVITAVLERRRGSGVSLKSALLGRHQG